MSPCCFPLNSLFLCRRSNSLALSAEYWKVYGGVVSLDRLPQPYLVKQIVLNENYNSKTNDQDVALLKLTSPVRFDGQCQNSVLTLAPSLAAVVEI